MADEHTGLFMLEQPDIDSVFKGRITMTGSLKKSQNTH